MRSAERGFHPPRSAFVLTDGARFELARRLPVHTLSSFVRHLPSFPVPFDNVQSCKELRPFIRRGRNTMKRLKTGWHYVNARYRNPTMGSINEASEPR
jgi:hypothetical protein